MDEVVVSHGYDRDFGNLVQWGLAREDYGVSVDQRMRTNIPGIFGAGDFITYGSKVRLIAGAFNDAVLAVNSAKMYLEPGASDMAGVSSHNARFYEKNKALLLNKTNLCEREKHGKSPSNLESISCVRLAFFICILY